MVVGDQSELVALITKAVVESADAADAISFQKRHAEMCIEAIEAAGYRIVVDQPGHFVTFDERGWFIEHSLDCRIAGTIGTCEFNEAIREHFNTEPPPPEDHGRWKIAGIEAGCPTLVRPR